MKTRLILAALVMGTFATGAASAAEPMTHHRKPMHHVTTKHHKMMRHHAAMQSGMTTTRYGAPNRKPLSSGNSPTVAREGTVADPLSVPGSDAAIYNYSPNDRNSAYGY